MPQTVGVRDAKARLSKLLRRVDAGDVVTITDRGRPVARLVPVAPPTTSLEERLAELERRGWIRRPQGRAPRFSPLRLRPEGLAQRILQEDRDRE